MTRAKTGSLRGNPSVTFHGAARTVTGSRYLLRSDRARVLVDCGLFQGGEDMRARNREDPGFDPRSLDAVVLTHAHVDHAGYLPRLCASGYSGPVLCTPGTRSLLGILLRDGAHLQEEEVRRAARRGRARRPLYTRADVETALALLQPRPFHAPFDVALGMSARFARAGHILGAASVAVRVEDRSINFTGDVGRPQDPVMVSPEPLWEADYLVTESTYGDRLHPDSSVFDVLERIVVETAARGGSVLVPAFAVGRAQHLMHLLAELRAEGRVPELPTFLDSPMAIDATHVFCDHLADHRLSPEQCRAACGVARYTRTVAESRAINETTGPKVVISASGMATGGRVLHHLRRMLPDYRNTVLFAGFQAPGTRGHALVHGAAAVDIHGRSVQVRARVESLGGLSAHGDYAEMLAWLAESDLSPRRVFVTHGEGEAADAFGRRLQEAFGWEVEVPSAGSCWALD